MYRNAKETQANTTLSRSRRQRSLCLSFLETSGYQRLRRYAGLEVGF